MLEKAILLAKENDYDTARYEGEWNGFAVFRPAFLDDEPHYLGFPEVILVQNGIARFSTYEEAMAYQSTFSEPIDEKEQAELLRILNETA